MWREDHNQREVRIWKVVVVAYFNMHYYGIGLARLRKTIKVLSNYNRLFSQYKTTYSLHELQILLEIS